MQCFLSVLPNASPTFSSSSRIRSEYWANVCRSDVLFSSSWIWKTGNKISNRVPFPSTDTTLLSPETSWIRSCTTESPSPVPSPCFFVVKNGVKICFWISGDMPGPLSDTVTAYFMLSPSMIRLPFTVIQPPFSFIACTALLHRLTMIWFTIPALPIIPYPVSGSIDCSNVLLDGTVFLTSFRLRSTSSTICRSTFLPLPFPIWPYLESSFVRSLALVAAVIISRIRALLSSLMASSASSKSPYSMIGVRKLLNSWEIMLVMVPRVCTLSIWRSCSSRLCSSSHAAFISFRWLTSSSMILRLPAFWKLTPRTIADTSNNSPVPSVT